MQKSREDMEIQRKLELDSLQMQINPHFLYNTLDAIAWMAKIKKEPEIEKLVMNLAKFFRLSLHKGDKYITVKEEVELVKCYLEIDKIRYPGKVEVTTQIESGLEECKTLKLILQPIIENSLKYAFPDRNGNIKIKVYSYENDLCYEITDDGVGFDIPSALLENKKDPKTLSGYGLYNINERIKLEYGENYGLEIFSKIGEGTKIQIRIAKKTE
jgi:two-component system sensor histidine kinase YesM